MKNTRTVGEAAECAPSTCFRHIFHSQKECQGILVVSATLYLKELHALRLGPLLRVLCADLARRLAQVALVAEQHARRAGPRVPQHLLHPLVEARKTIGIGEIADEHDRVGLPVVPRGDGEIFLLPGCKETYK